MICTIESNGTRIYQATVYGNTRYFYGVGDAVAWVANVTKGGRK